MNYSRIYLQMKFNLLTCLIYTFMNIPITRASLLVQSPATRAVSDDPRIERHGTDVQTGDSDARPKPCCLPYRFQAVTTDLSSFTADTKDLHLQWTFPALTVQGFSRPTSGCSPVTFEHKYLLQWGMVNRLYRNWDTKMQIQENVMFNSEGIQQSLLKVFMDYQNMVSYTFTPGRPCQRTPIDYGMLEPCMPGNATYLGKSYIGAYSERTRFNAWNFKRTNLNRNIEITIAVTSDRCVPVSERITGQIAGSKVDVLVLFSNVTEDVNNSVFNVPLECLELRPM